MSNLHRLAEGGEGRGRYLDVLSVKTPLGMREQLKAAAATENISVGEFVRRSLGSRIAACPDADLRDSVRPPTHDSY
jgi:hypothetical protein